MLSKDLLSVVAFHENFLLPNSVLPKPMTQDMIDFRVPFLYEEYSEFEEAWNGRNLVQAVDALLDLVYVAIGTALFIGMGDRHRGFWPRFDDVLWACRESGFIRPSAPKFLPIGMHMHFAAALKSRIDLFVLAHSAAVAGELNALDASLIDLRHLVNGCHVAADLMGVPWDECFEYVHAANMAKQRAASDGSDSARRTPWDVVKPKNFVAPDARIARTLLEAGWEVNGLDVNYRTGKVQILEAQQ